MRGVGRIVDADPLRRRTSREGIQQKFFAEPRITCRPRGRSQRGCATVETRASGCRAARTGIDVIVGKNRAASLAEADQLLSAAARANRILQVGHLERFNPGIVARDSCHESSALL